MSFDRSRPPGAIAADGGVHFGVCSGAADSIEVCLFDAAGAETARHALENDGSGTWRGFVPGLSTGQRYGYRARGPYDPLAGLRFNPAKLLIDPYARALDGRFVWSPALFDFDIETAAQDGSNIRISHIDSAGHLPFSVVTDGLRPPTAGPRIPWRDTIVYESNVRGFTMRHPALDDSERGRFSGLANGQIIDYLRALGVTSIEFQPVFEYVDEHFLTKKGLANFWGYNSVAFFAPASRLTLSDGRAEFVDMVNALHDAGLEVILDVAYNHTAEAGIDGPTLSFRGLDNLAYYRTDANDLGLYVNDTGTGNTVNADHPFVQRLVVDSLRYWASDMGVDGFRFDLGPVLGRSRDGYSATHPLLTKISEDEVLKDRKLIAEPWDPGPGGYQLGNFPPAWGEWNDQYRDSVRRFWRGDDGEAPEFATRIAGSADLMAGKQHGPAASVNFVTAHDGFTLADTVSYEKRHNEANGEDNRDGHAHNYSANYGVEGPSADASIAALRRRQRLNMLATLLLSRGTPMLLAGDEFGNSQGGNNNAYAQDNETGWLDWSLLDADPAFPAIVRTLVLLRKELDFLDGYGDDLHMRWLDADGLELDAADWPEVDCLAWLIAPAGEKAAVATAIVFNRSAEERRLRVPEVGGRRDWALRFVSAADEFRPVGGGRWHVPPRSLVCAVLEGVADSAGNE